MFAAIGTLAGAYFGYHAGSAGKTAADQERRAAESARHAEAEKTQRLAVLAHETHADKVEKILGR
jgi:cell division protein FtsB